MSLFKKHGAFEVVTPLLSPYLTTCQQSNATRVMSQSGVVVLLPCELRTPFIKYIANTGINLMRRYTVGRIYRDHKIINSHPKQMYECVFDIISPEGSKLNLKSYLKNHQMLFII